MGFGLALSGGGIRGAAHVGVICALEEEGLNPSAIAGTSAGSIVAGLYSVGYDGERLRQIMKDIQKNKNWFLDYDIFGLLKGVGGMMFRRELHLDGLIKGNNLELYLKELTGGRRISNCSLDLVIPAVDIVSGDTIVYTNYNVIRSSLCEYRYGEDEYLSEIIRASCSIPAIFKPKTIGHSILIDGGVTNNLPVNLLIKNGCKNVIAVDITKDFIPHKNNKMINITGSAFNIMSNCLKELTSTGEILNLAPRLPKEASILNFDMMEKCMDIGYEYTRSMMPTIKAVIDNI